MIHNEDEIYAMGRKVAVLRNLGELKAAESMAAEFRQLRDGYGEAGSPLRVSVSSVYMKGYLDHRVVED